MTDSNTSSSNIFMNFNDALSLAHNEADRALSSSPSVIRTYTVHLAGTKGKFIRAVSLLTCAMNKDGRVDANTVKLAAAIEILHLATLVHDDVIDNADIRRGMPSLQKMFGSRTAVICGDYLLCTALRIASSIGNKEKYLELDMPDYVAKVCTGELYQHINNGNYELSVYQYLKIIFGKTAALFEASFFAGAIMSDCAKSELKLYKKMGRCLGMIFQLIDDCMDFEATEGVAKKPVQSDFEKDVITLPMIKAFQSDTVLRERAARHELTGNELNDAVRRTGGVSFTRLVAKKYYNKYMKLLNKLDMTQDKREGLANILNRAFRVF